MARNLKRKKKGFMLFSAVLSSIVFILIAQTFFMLYGNQFSLIKNGNIALQARQYANIDANTLSLTAYEDLDSKGAHGRQAITKIANATGWEDEVIIGKEQIIDEETSSKQRIATCNIYRKGDTQPRYTMEVPLSSQGSGTTIPTGMIMWFPNSRPPAGWLECNGQNTDAYPKLAAIVGNNVPDLRGKFIRGIDNGVGIDKNRIFASLQNDTLQNITGQFYMMTPGNFNSSIDTTGAFSSAGGWCSVAGNADYWTPSIITFDASRIARTSSETRPINIALLPCIKY